MTSAKLLTSWKEYTESAKTAEEEYQKLGAIIFDAKQPITRVVDEILEKT